MIHPGRPLQSVDPVFYSSRITRKIRVDSVAFLNRTEESSKMQTLQYPLGTSELASFDPLAVPAPFDPQPQLSAETQLPSNLSSNDVLLTTLGEEPLFQGTRNVSAIGENLPRPLLKSSAQETGVVVSEASWCFPCLVGPHNVAERTHFNRSSISH